MSTFTQPRDTRWGIGPGSFTLELPDALRTQRGVLVTPAVVDVGVGEEATILWLEPDWSAADAQLDGGLRLEVAPGLAVTEAGAVGYIMLALVGAADSAEAPLSVHELVFDPKQPAEHRAIHELARQSHWHVFVVGGGQRILRIAEFSNEFDLLRSVGRIVAMASGASGVAHPTEGAAPEGESPEGESPEGESPTRGAFDAARRRMAELYPLSERWAALHRRRHLGPTPEEVRKRDVSRVAAEIASLGSGPLAGRDRMGQVHLHLALAGAPDGPTGLAEPAFSAEPTRAWVAALFASAPDLFFYLDPVSPRTLDVAMALAPMKASEDGAIVLPGAALRALAWRALDGVRDRLVEAGVHEELPLVRRHMLGLMGLFGTRDFR